MTQALLTLQQGVHHEIVDKIIDYRKTFAELEAPCAELNRAIDSLV